MKKQRDLNIIKSAGQELNLGTRTVVSKKIYSRKKKFKISDCVIKDSTIRAFKQIKKSANK